MKNGKIKLSQQLLALVGIAFVLFTIASVSIIGTTIANSGTTIKNPSTKLVQLKLKVD